MLSLCNLSLGALRGYRMVQVTRSMAPAAFGSHVSPMQRRFRHSPKPYLAPLRLKAPLKSRKAVQAYRLLREIRQLKGTRFSHVTMKAKASARPSAARYLSALGITTPDSTIHSQATSSFGFFKKTVPSLFSCSWGTVDWQRSILVVDLANCIGHLKLHRPGKTGNVTRRALDDLVQISGYRGCQVFVMV